MTASPQAQTSLYETTIEDAALEQLLEQREQRKEQRAEANRKYRETNDLVKLKLSEHDIADGPVRIGRWVVKETRRDARHVEFDVDASSRLQISLLADE